MDANGTQFHLLLGLDDWASCLDGQLRPLQASWADSSQGVDLNKSGVDWVDERAEVTLQKRLFQFTATSRDVRPSLKDRRGAARDRYGNWYWIDETRREILINSSGTLTTTHFWSSTDRINCNSENVTGDFHTPEPAPAKVAWELSGLAVTEDHYLVAGVLEPAGLLIFDLHGGGAPRQLLWPVAVKFAPFDLVAAANGGFFVLDRNNQRYWAFDRHFKILGPEPVENNNPSEAGEDFQAKEGSAVRPTNRGERVPREITDDSACPLQTGDAIGIEALPDGTVLILDGNPDVASPPTGRFSFIHRYRFREELGESASTEVILDRIESNRETFNLIGYDFAFVPDGGVDPGAEAGEKFLGHLYIVERSGNQSYAFLLKIKGEQLVLKALADYLPMRLFGGRALVVADSSVYYDFENQWVKLVAQPRPRYALEANILTPLADEDAVVTADGKNLRGAFDGREPDCVWHRLMLDACIPPDAEVQVWSRAANDQRELALAEWRQEPRPYLRGNGSELPFTPRASKEIKGQGTWELLFQNARGRFLQLQLTLIGNGRTTPRLRALRAYYPRFSYLNHYLPAVYREDTESASFLDRFLANVEGTYTAIEDRIAAAQMLFDTRVTPPDALDWLAAWFGLALDPIWDDERKRIFIKHAIDFFNCRGTMRGLEIALRIALDSCIDESIFTDDSKRANASLSGIRIVERYRTRLAASVVFGDPTNYDGIPAGLSSTRWLTAETALGGVNRPSGSAATASMDFESLHGVPPCKEKANPGLVAAGADNSKSGDGPAAIAAERQGWQTFLVSRYANIDAFNAAYTLKGEPRRSAFTEIPLPDDLPPGGEPLDDWLQWLAVSTQTGNARERKLWQDFLARRYRLIAALNRTYETQWVNFEVVSLPNTQPTRNLEAQDWQLFGGVVLAMHRRAHRFTVLLPVPPAHRDNGVALDERRARAERIINLEKPAHTSFDAKFYWAAFRLGEARLGTDTIVDRGSRMLHLIQPMILDQTYLAEGYLASRNPPDLADRQIIGRTRLGC
jgi:phage tail-like protein